MIQELRDIENRLQRLQEAAARELKFADLDDREVAGWPKVAERLRRAQTNVLAARKRAQDLIGANYARAGQ